MANEVKEEEFTISEAKLKKLKNLKFFKYKNDIYDPWTDEEITAHIKGRQKGQRPPSAPEVVGDLPPAAQQQVAMDEKELQKKFDRYLLKYRKEFGVDLNEANDIESLRAYVRYVIQSEMVDKAILTEQSKPSPYTKTLKELGDFQRTLQQNMNEIQDRLGISRKQRKDKQVDDIPQYINEIQQKAKNFWNRKTVPVVCEKDRIELARIWLNFEDVITVKDNIETHHTPSIRYEGMCPKCHEMIVYAT